MMTKKAIQKNIKRTIKAYSEQFYAHILDNLDETDQFLERVTQLKPIPGEVNNY